jgi:hypothetical protein
MRWYREKKQLQIYATTDLVVNQTLYPVVVQIRQNRWTKRVREELMFINITAPKERPVYVRPYVLPPPVDVEGYLEAESLTRAGLLVLKVVCDNETTYLASQINSRSLKARIKTLDD